MSKTPRKTIADRVADILPGVKAAQAGVMLQDLQATQQAHRRRTADGHKAMAKAAGVEIDDPNAGDDMGDIVITGDITVTQSPAPSPAATPPPLPSPAQQPKSQFPKLLAKAAITAALVGSGAGAAMPWLLGMFDKTPPPVVTSPPEQWTERRLELYMPPK